MTEPRTLRWGGKNVRGAMTSLFVCPKCGNKGFELVHLNDDNWSYRIKCEGCGAHFDARANRDARGEEKELSLLPVPPVDTRSE